jgi:lysyl-tRNA synthetase class 2
MLAEHTERLAPAPDWAPSATLAVLRQRAQLIAKIRAFFAGKNVLEVDTPLLSNGTVTDPHVIGIPAIFKNIGSTEEKILYLQTSPEYAMKRLLAAGSGCIYQICKAFRQGEIGRRHNPEFTMLEWYRLGYDHHALMDEMDELLQLVLNTAPAERFSYADLFLQYLHFNPHTVTVENLMACAQQNNIALTGILPNHNAWLDLLWSHCIEPLIGQEKPVFLYDFPASQASLAKLRPGNPPLASRFEVYFKGVELANGFHELQDAAEQTRRFAADLRLRTEMGLPQLGIDKNFIAALEAGLPECAGVALGIDRLIMLALSQECVADVISFTIERA